TLAGRYQVERKIATGGMAEVWGGRNQATGEPVALKRLRSAASSNPEIVARFRREADLLRRVSSDSGTKLHDLLDDPEYGLVMVQELIDGLPASAMMASRLSVEEALALGCEILWALSSLHEARVVHRDLKPGNILLQRLGPGAFRTVIIDL